MFSSIKNPIWANTDNTAINVEITTDSTGLQEFLFTATPYDSESYGRQIYADCVAGVYGPVAPYVAPSPTPVVPTEEQNKQTAVKLLQQTDWVNEPDVYDPANDPHLTNRQAFLTYRAALRQIAVYPEPGNLDWPVKPTEQWSQ